MHVVCMHAYRHVLEYVSVCVHTCKQKFLEYISSKQERVHPYHTGQFLNDHSTTSGIFHHHEVLRNKDGKQINKKIETHFMQQYLFRSQIMNDGDI